MADLLQMAGEIVSAQASTQPMSTEDVVKSLSTVHKALKDIEAGGLVQTDESVVESQEDVPVMSMRKAFGKKKIFCMICGKGMTTLSKHIKQIHDMSPAEYKDKFGIPRSKSLAASDYVDSRRQMAIDRGLGDNLAKARAAKKKAAAPAPSKKPVEGNK